MVTGALGAAGCGEDPPRTALRVELWNGGGAAAGDGGAAAVDGGAPATAAAPRPTSVTLSWLDAYGFLLKDRPFAIADGTGAYLGDLLVGAYVADAGSRRAIVRGWRAGQAISVGWGSTSFAAGQPAPPVTVQLLPLQAGAPDPNDADHDDVPDAVDNCPGLPNADQTNQDCS